jgi:hypothetical protein
MQREAAKPQEETRRDETRQLNSISLCHSIKIPEPLGYNFLHLLKLQVSMHFGKG